MNSINKYLYIIIFLGILCINDGGIFAREENYIPKEGYVPNKETAIKIAEAIWLPIYGKSIYDFKPFVAELSKDKAYWIVTGTLKPIRIGGVPYAEIRKKDCMILKVTHGE